MSNNANKGSDKPELTPEETAEIEAEAKAKAIAESAEAAAKAEANAKAEAAKKPKPKPLTPTERTELAGLEKLAMNGRRQPAPGQMFRLSELRARAQVG